VFIRDLLRWTCPGCDDQTAPILGGSSLLPIALSILLVPPPASEAGLSAFFGRYKQRYAIMM